VIGFVFSPDVPSETPAFRETKPLERGAESAR
jgi:hypothetical protein